MTAPKRPARPRNGEIKGRAPRVILPIKMAPELRHRLKVAAAEEGTTYAGLFQMFLDQRDAKLRRQRAAQVHPLHQPRDEPKSAYPSGAGGGGGAGFTPGVGFAAGGGGGGR